MKRDFQIGDAVYVTRIQRENNPAVYLPEMEHYLRKVSLITEVGHLFIRLNKIVPDDLGFDIAFPIEDIKLYRKVKLGAAIVPKPAPIAKKIRTLEEALIAKGSPGLCSWAIELEPGEYMFYMRQPCHSQFAYDWYKYAKKIAVSLIGYEKTFGLPYKQYADYILNESPWANCFQNVALAEVVFLNLDKPAYQLYAALVALREGNEHNGKLKMFSNLLDKGYCGHTAFILSNYVYGELNNPKLGSFSNWHHVLHGNMNVEQLFKFFREGYFIPYTTLSYKEKSHKSLTIAKYIAHNQEESITNFLNRVGECGIEFGGWGDKMQIFNSKNVILMADALDAELNVKEVK